MSPIFKSSCVNWKVMLKWSKLTPFHWAKLLDTLFVGVQNRKISCRSNVKFWLVQFLLFPLFHFTLFLKFIGIESASFSTTHSAKKTECQTVSKSINFFFFLMDPRNFPPFQPSGKGLSIYNFICFVILENGKKKMFSNHNRTSNSKPTRQIWRHEYAECSNSSE